MRLQQLHTTITLEGMFRYLELVAWHDSWVDAAHRNIEDRG